MRFFRDDVTMTPDEATTWLFAKGLNDEIIYRYASDKIDWGRHFGQAVLTIATRPERGLEYSIRDSFVRARKAKPSFKATIINGSRVLVIDDKESVAKKSKNEFETIVGALKINTETDSTNVLNQISRHLAPGENIYDSEDVGHVMWEVGAYGVTDPVGLVGWDAQSYCPFADTQERDNWLVTYCYACKDSIDT